MSEEARTYSKKILKAKELPIALLFLVWPFALLYTSLKNFRAPGAKKGFILFCLYFGFVFVISRDLGGADSARYAQMLREMHELTPNFDNFLASIYSSETNYVDIYQPFLTWFVSLFTDNPHYLFALFGLVFGYFYANNLWIVLGYIKQRIYFPIFLFILTLSLINPIWNINGVRMWTAAQIFVYGVLLYFLNGNKKGLLWAMSSILVHFSFLFPVSLLLTFIFLPKKLPIFFLFFLGTSLISEIDLLGLRHSLSFLPLPLLQRVNVYTQESVTLYQIKMAWYVTFAYNALKWVQYSFITIVFLSSRKVLTQNSVLYVLFCFTLFLFGWANISSLVPSGARFIIIANVLTFTFIILVYNELKITKLMKWVRLLSIPFLVFFCIINIRAGFDYIGVSTFVGNPFSSLLIEDNTPLIEFIKSFF